MAQPSLRSELLAALADGDGLVRAADCRGLGISQDRIERMLRAGLLVPLAKGVYADRRHVACLSAWPLFGLKSRAFVLASPVDTYASDWSAVAMHQMPTTPQPPAVA